MRTAGSLARQQRLVRLLDERRGLSADAAAAELGCDRRTVYRDFTVLEEAGFPLYQEPEGRRMRWRLGLIRFRGQVGYVVPSLLGMLPRA